MLPVMLQIKDKSILVVGGGKVALRKVRTFLKEGALVTVAAPQILPELLRENIKYIKSEYSSEYIKGHFIITAATNNPALNRKIAADARANGILCLSVSDWQCGDFISMVYENNGNVTAALSTNGQDPSCAKKMRPYLTELITKIKKEYDNGVKDNRT